MTNPVPGYKVTTAWGIPGSWAAGRHTGQDYAAPTGAKVVAARTGTVVYSGNGGGWGAAYGQHIIIDSGGVRHMYAHLSWRGVPYGKVVKAGEQIGRVGETGRAFGPHLHYEERTAPYIYGVNDRKPLFPSSGTGGSTPTGFGDYTYGKNHPAHRALQRRLKEKGCDPGYGDWPTDYYGNGTKNAVSCFQRKQGWSGSDADGLIGPGTLDKLGLPEKMAYRSSKRVYASKMRMGQADSDSVWNVQVALLLAGYSIPAGPTDYFGQQTKTAVAEFQKRQGWTGADADGIPGPGTIKALGLQWVQDVESKPDPVEPVQPPATTPGVMPPDAIWEPIAGFPGLREFAEGGGAKIVLHTVESNNKPNWAALKSGIPHLTFDPKTGKVWQHLAFDVAAYTLKGGEHSPNSGAGVSIQIEMIGYAKDVPNWSDEDYFRLRSLLLWLCSTLKVPFVFPFPFTGSSGYGEGGAVRQTWVLYRAASGIVDHANVPYNTHWDVGKLDVIRLLDDDGEDVTEPEKPEPPEPPEPPVPPEPNPDYATKADLDELRTEFDAWRKTISESFWPE